ncbi:MAG: aminoglycoside phosphotransferase family protein [Actinobacteria bacterium]|nr:MAG: aminoglycoside phosphotransferase family protein [Actinomycetota bacterium]
MDLLARGRAADVYAVGPGRVLRRYRPGEREDTTVEAAVMEQARRHGFPVPAVYQSSGRDLVLERIDGPTMMADVADRPWRVRRHGRTLAALHRQLHRIPAPSGADAPLGRGDRLVHLDLHPENVLLSSRGPVVIDWSNGSRGDPADDVALTWAILATSAIPGPLPFRVLARAGRGLLLGAFLGGVDADAARERLAEVAGRRLRIDPHLHEPERRALERLVARSRPGHSHRTGGP